MDYSKHFNPRQTPQSEPMPGREAEQARNNAGGYAFTVDHWTDLERFLVLGTQDGTYYVGEAELTRENCQSVLDCIKEDGVQVVAKVLDISLAGRAPKQDPALFVLALCLTLGNQDTKMAAQTVVPRVARTGTHLFHLVQFLKSMRGTGRVFRRTFANWYQSLPEDKLALQLVKYRQRDGWTHRDLLRLCHAKTNSPSRNNLFRFAVDPEYRTTDCHPLVGAYQMAQEPRTADDLVHLITEYNLPRECIPTQYLQSPEIWSALLPGMPMTAMIRNLGKMTAVGILGPGSPGQHLVVEALTNQDRLKKARIHPIAILSAMKVYQQGTGVRGSLTWRPNRTIVDALDDAFYASFGNVTPTGLRTLVALDVSGSMTYQVNGLPHLSCREAAAAMSLVVAKTEQNWEIHGFTSALGAYSYSSRFSRDYTAALEGFIELDISPRQRLDDVVRTTGSLPFGGTDCALPMLWAQKNSREFDAIHIITDNETWAGTIHPVEALRNYRQASGLPTKLVVWGMASNGFSIADPRDGGMMDIVGLDAAAPNLANDFLRS